MFVTDLRPSLGNTLLTQYSVTRYNFQQTATASLLTHPPHLLFAEMRGYIAMKALYSSKTYFILLIGGWPTDG